MLQYHHPSDSRLNLFRLGASGSGSVAWGEDTQPQDMPVDAAEGTPGGWSGDLWQTSFYPSGLQIAISKQRQQAAWEGLG